MPNFLHQIIDIPIGDHILSLPTKGIPTDIFINPTELYLAAVVQTPPEQAIICIWNLEKLDEAHTVSFLLTVSKLLMYMEHRCSDPHPHASLTYTHPNPVHNSSFQDAVYSSTSIPHISKACFSSDGSTLLLASAGLLKVHNFIAYTL